MNLAKSDATIDYLKILTIIKNACHIFDIYFCTSTGGYGKFYQESRTQLRITAFAFSLFQVTLSTTCILMDSTASTSINNCFHQIVLFCLIFFLRLKKVFGLWWKNWYVRVELFLQFLYVDRKTSLEYIVLSFLKSVLER